MTTLLTFLGSAIGTLAGVLLNTKLITFRLEQLERKVDNLSALDKRIIILEERMRQYESK